MRYPDSGRASDARYFKAGRHGYLHRRVWEVHRGPIPKGHHIHHVDGDGANNAIENLECLSAADHERLHHAGHCSPANRAALAKAQEAAKIWHASEEGRKWHSENAVLSWARREPLERRCARCSEPYQTRHRGKAIYCSEKCKAAARRRSGVDDIERMCAECGAAFRSNRYGKQQCCSLSCGVRRGKRISRGL